MRHDDKEQIEAARGFADDEQGSGSEAHWGDMTNTIERAENELSRNFPRENSDDIIRDLLTELKETQAKLERAKVNYAELHKYAFQSNCLSGVDNFDAPYKEDK